MGQTKVFFKNVSQEIWEEIKTEYETSKTTFNKLGQKYRVHPKKISRKAKEESWAKFEPLPVVANGKRIINPNGMLNSIAVRKIKEILEEIKGHYSPVDEPLVLAYAKNYQRYLELEAIVDEEGVVLISPKTGASYTNPSFNALQSVINNLQKIGAQLGLSIASRKRLGLVLGEEEKSAGLFDLIEDLKDKGDRFEI